MSAARPKIANYPFTTLIPHLGVVEAGDTQFVVADVPGLIPGASEGTGLGLDFLRHVERCSVLVHVIDCATAGARPRSGHRPRRDRGRTDRLRRADRGRTGRAARGSWCSTRSTCPRPATSPRSSGPTCRPGTCESTRSRPPPARDCASLPSRWRRSSAEARSAAPAALPTRLVIRPEPVAGPDFELVREGENAFLISGRQAAPVDPADRLQQRRSGRIPGRPAGQAGYRGSAGRGRRRCWRRGADRRRGQFGGIRLGSRCSRPAQDSARVAPTRASSPSPH